MDRTTAAPRQPAHELGHRHVRDHARPPARRHMAGLAVGVVLALAAAALAGGVPAQAATPPRVVRTTVYFTAARTITFTAPSRTTLARLAASVPRSRAGVTVAVTGYTLAPRNTAAVVRLSLAHANTAVAALKARGVRARFTARGAGRWAAGGATARRAVIVVTIPAAPTTTTVRPTTTTVRPTTSTTVPAAPTSSTSTTAPGSTSSTSTTTPGGGSSTSTSTPPTTTPTTTTTAPPSSVVLGSVASITTGATHTCAALTDGTARCWGANAAGQLGNGSTTASPLAVPVRDAATGTPLGTVTTVAAGAAHSCAVLADTTARCWGANAAGQLGDGTTVSSSSAVAVADPVDPTQPLSGVSSITAGAAHTCALLTDGTARCWGAGTNGQLGDGGAAAGQALLPTVVVDPAAAPGALGGLTSITAGDRHTCAVLTDATARCWGAGALGQLGSGASTDSDVAVTVVDPVDTVQALAGVASVDAGTDHACATLTDATSRCWGLNDGTQLGDGSSTTSNVPVTVLDPTDVNVTQQLAGAAAVTGGGTHSCAALADGSARCWGTGADGQLGNGPILASAVPAPVLDPANTNQALGNITAVDAGAGHTCAVLGDGGVRCWGLGTSGQLGSGAASSSTLPVTVRATA